MLFKMTIIMVSRNKYILYSKIYDKSSKVGRGEMEYQLHLNKAVKKIKEYG